TISNSTLSGNSTFNNGGGISNKGTLTISNSTLSGNSATSSAAGGIWNQGTLTISNSTLSNNAAGGGGGINNKGTVTIDNSTLSGNSGSHFAGGIYNYADPSLTGTLSISNSIVASSKGGDIVNTGNISGSGNLVADGSDGLPDTIKKDPLL